MRHPVMNPTNHSRFGKKSTMSGRRFTALCSAATLALVLSAHSVRAEEKVADPMVKKSASGDAVVLDEFVVAGVRGSLVSAQEIKQNSPQFVDSIVAQDIGKFPDNTVADALQRVPGIQVARDNGEVNSVVIRGLPNLGTTLNGHEIFTGTGRGVALQDIPAELVAGVDVYKTNTPEQIEGGIAGLIDIRLHRPFDFKGFAFSAGSRAIEGKYADKTSLVGSFLVSDRWKLSGGGEFGALLSISGSRYHFKDQRVFNFLWEPVDAPAAPIVTGQTKIVLPVTAGSLVTPGDRKRSGDVLSLQWRTNNELEIYTDLLFTSYRNAHDVNFFIGFPRFGAFQTVNLVPGTNIVANEITTNNFHLNSTQAFNDRTDSYQAAVGAKWHRDALKVTTEAVYNWSSFKNRAVIVDVQYVAPSTFAFDLTNPNGTNVNVTGGDIRDGKNFRLWGLFDNHGYATSKETAWKADADYQVGQGVLTNLKAGVRISDRDARSRQTSANDIAPAAGRGVTLTTSIPGFGSLAPDGLFSRSEFGASNWYAGDANFLRNNAATLRPLFGQPTRDPDFNPTQSFTDKEKTYAGYVQGGYKIETGANPIEGVVGFRVVKTDQSLVGNLASGAPVNGDKDQVDILPVLNGRVKLEQDLLLRFSAGRSITRPDFAALSPVVSLFGATTTGGALGTGSGGNPDLKTVRSDNYDVALEYYFAKGSYVSVTGFYRSIDGYVQTFASVDTIGGTQYIVTRPRNSGKGHLDGIEASYQHFPDFLPSVLKGFGWQTNFTFIEGQNNAADPTSTAAVAPLVNQPYTQVSKYSYNLVGIYERAAFSARLAYNWRGKYVDTFNGPNSPASGLRTINVKSTDWMDFSASYAFGKNFTVTFDATNLLNQKYHDYFGDNSSLYPRDSRRFDRTYALGLRYRY